MTNYLLDRCDDELIHQWVALLESHQEEAHGHYLEESLRASEQGRK